MPIYSYECNTCKKQSDQIHAYDDTHGPCEHCNGISLRKLLTAPTLRMNGMQSMSTRHTTEETFGAHPNGGAHRMGKVEYFPEERAAKAEQLRKKAEGKGATVSMPKTTFKDKKK